jgi:hypothetical protein
VRVRDIVEELRRASDAARTSRDVTVVLERMLDTLMSLG